MDIRSDLQKAIDRPDDAAIYVTNKLKSQAQRAKIRTYRKVHSIDRQQPLIQRFVNNDEFILIVLDACRYDIFKDTYKRFFNGEMKKVWASGRWTAEYTRRTWTGQYDFTYLSSMPVVSDFYFKLRGWNFIPSDHIECLIPLWDTDWDPALGTVPPDKVTDAALAHTSQMESTRLVVHYAQPHAPYIGETEILPWEKEPEGMRQLLEQDIDRPTQRIYKQIENGEISRSKLHDAYISNLKCALKEVIRLIRRVDCPVVVTGDHGEHLGDSGKYLHEEDSTLIRQVPWCVVDEGEIGQKPIEAEYRERDLHSSEYHQPPDKVKERLADLGYSE